MSPPPPSVGPHKLPKFWGKKPKAITKVTLQEPPIKVQIFTTRQRSCMKVMFSQVFVCPPGGGCMMSFLSGCLVPCSFWGSPFREVYFQRGVSLQGGRYGTHPVVASSGSHQSGQYASYWNASLFLIYLTK